MAEEEPNTPEVITKPGLLAQLKNSSLYENGIATWQTVKTGNLVAGVIQSIEVSSDQIIINVKVLMGRKQGLQEPWQRIGGADKKICTTKDIDASVSSMYADGRVSWFMGGQKFIFCLFPNNHTISVDLRTKFEGLPAS